MYHCFVHTHFSFHSVFTYCWINYFRHKNQLFLNWTSCLTKEAEVQCDWICHECLLWFFFFFGKLCQTQTVSGVHFTFKRKDQFLGGSYILHITVKNCVYFILFLQPKNCNKTVFSLQLLFTKIAFKKIARFPFWELCYFKYVFFLYFFASCENFYKTASIWIFYDYSSVIWVILSM